MIIFTDAIAIIRTTTDLVRITNNLIGTTDDVATINKYNVRITTNFDIIRRDSVGITNAVAAKALLELKEILLESKEILL